MIHTFQELGKKELEGLTESEKKRKFLLTQTIKPNEPQPDDEDRDKYQEVVINLNTEKEEIEIKLGKEIAEENREEFFGFELLGRRSKKIYFTANNLYYHLLTIPQLIEYIKEKLNQKDYSSFLEYLIELKQMFYTEKEQEKSYLKLEKFNTDIKSEIKTYLDNEVGHNTVRESLEEYISKDLLGSSKKTFINNLNVFSLKINNEYIMETKFSNDYINIVYYERQGRFFSNSERLVRKNALCSGCNQFKQVTGKIDIPTKFYVTSSPNFFEDLEKKNAYKSFGICQECYQEIMVGIEKVKNNYSSQLFKSLNYYLIPENIENDYDRQLKLINRLLSQERDNFNHEVKLLKDIRARNLKVDFLFWYRPQGQAAAFVVADSINDVYYSDLQELFSSLREINRSSLYKESLPAGLKPKLNSIYWLLFPNYKSHSNPDPKLYRKELLNLFNSILKQREVDYKYLIKNFVFIFRKRFFKNKRKIENIIYHPLQMNILLSWFNKITNLRGGITLKEGKNMTEIDNEDIKEFFSTHNQIYANNSYRQGLFILGKLMNEVLKEQQKEDKSANILDKLSFDGLPVRRVKKFVKDITEILNIYDKYQVNQLLHAQMMDRLQGVEDSELDKDEVVFYILSGISFGRYLGHKYGKNKQSKQEGDQ